MKSKAGTEIDVIVLDGGKPCLLPRLQSGIPDPGETVPGRAGMPPEPGRLMLAAGPQVAVQPYRLVIARYSRVRNHRRARWRGVAGDADAALFLPAGRRGRQHRGPREHRA